MAPQLLLPPAVTSPRVRLAKHLADRRILLCPLEASPVRVLLSLAETAVQSGAIRNPLQYYGDVANQPSPWVALSDRVADPGLRICHISSGDVRKVSVSLALCPGGFRSESGEAIHLIFLISSPSGSLRESLALVAQIDRLLRSREDRQSVLRASRPEEALRVLQELEQRSAVSTNPEAASREAPVGRPRSQTRDRKHRVI